jgi:hypothetical protein
MRKLQINWKELNDLGDDLEKNILDFEANRLLLAKEMSNVINYWTGTDAVVYQAKALEYISSLQDDVDYLYEWQKYFKNASKNYSKTEEDGLQRVRNSIDLLETESRKMNLNVDGGVYNG